MTAFLRRRWILLSCAVALLACSVVRIEKVTGNDHYTAITSLEDSGEFLFCLVDLPNSPPSPESNLHVSVVEHPPGLHLPKLGGKPAWNERASSSGITAITWKLPIWLPLLVVLGLLIIRELRWREKRARARDAAG